MQVKCPLTQAYDSYRCEINDGSQHTLSPVGRRIVQACWPVLGVDYSGLACSGVAGSSLPSSISLQPSLARLISRKLKPSNSRYPTRLSTKLCTVAVNLGMTTGQDGKSCVRTSTTTLSRANTSGRCVTDVTRPHPHISRVLQLTFATSLYRRRREPHRAPWPE